MKAKIRLDIYTKRLCGILLLGDQVFWNHTANYFSILILKSMHVVYHTTYINIMISLKEIGGAGFQSLWKDPFIIASTKFPRHYFWKQDWGLQIARIMIFLNVFVCDSGINYRLWLNLEKHSYASHCFRSQCLCGSVLASTGLMCGWTRMRRGKGQPENTDC